MRIGWGRSAVAQEHVPEADAASTGALAPVELLLDDGRREVTWIDTAGQRTSDWLNASPTMERYGSSDAAVVPADPPDRSVPAAPVSRDAIVWVVPPELPPNRHLRLHRRRVLLHLELDGWSVSGQAHVRPGADAVDQVLRGTRDLVPLTEVQVASTAEPGEPIGLPVLIVNRRHVRRVSEGTVSSVDTLDAVPDALRTDPRLALLAAAREPAVAEIPAPEAPILAAESDAAPVEDRDGLLGAVQALLDAGAIDIVEFQSIRARLPHPPA